MKKPKNRKFDIADKTLTKWGNLRRVVIKGREDWNLWQTELYNPNKKEK